MCAGVREWTGDADGQGESKGVFSCWLRTTVQLHYRLQPRLVSPCQLPNLTCASDLPNLTNSQPVTALGTTSKIFHVLVVIRFLYKSG